MTIGQIYEILDALSPFEKQEGWDNSGLQVGAMDEEVEQVVLSLDIDSRLVDSLEPRTLVISHHPLLFLPLKRLDFGAYPAAILRKMIKRDIFLISMHTNFDKTHLNRYVAGKLFGDKAECEELVCYARIEEEFDSYALKIKKILGLPNLKTVKAKDFVGKAALVCGSGGGMIEKIKADCFLTGDIKYHDAMMAKEMGISLIDIGHFESEIHFVDLLANHLKKTGLKVIISSTKNPFHYPRDFNE